jgi:hypothetical protein
METNFNIKTGRYECDAIRIKISEDPLFTK